MHDLPVGKIDKLHNHNHARVESGNDLYQQLALTNTAFASISPDAMNGHRALPPGRYNSMNGPVTVDFGGTGPMRVYAPTTTR